MKTLLSAITFLILMASCQNENSNPSSADASDTSSAKVEIKRINATDLVEMSKQDNVTILDVRTTDEYAQGFIAGTKQFIDYNSPSFEDQIDVLDKSKTYIVYCKSGNRSSKALNIMRDKGFENLCELEGGISSAPANLITLKK